MLYIFYERGGGPEILIYEITIACIAQCRQYFYFKNFSMAEEGNDNVTKKTTGTFAAGNVKG